jgi:hypothetical protein
MGFPQEHACPSHATSLSPRLINPRFAPTAIVHAGGGVNVVVSGPRLVGACPMIVDVISTAFSVDAGFSLAWSSSSQSQEGSQGLGSAVEAHFTWEIPRPPRKGTYVPNPAAISLAGSIPTRRRRVFWDDLPPLAPRTLFRFSRLPALFRVGKLSCRRALVCPPKCDRRADPRDAVPIFSQPRFSPRILEPLKIPRRNHGQPTSLQRREHMPAGGSFDLRRGQSTSAETC